MSGLHCSYTKDVAAAEAERLFAPYSGVDLEWLRQEIDISVWHLFAHGAHFTMLVKLRQQV